MIFCTATLTSVIGKSFGDESPFLLVKLINNSEILIGKMYQKHWPIHHVYFFLEKKITFIRFPSSKVGGRIAFEVFPGSQALKMIHYQKSKKYATVQAVQLKTKTFKIYMEAPPDMFLI